MLGLEGKALGTLLDPPIVLLLVLDGIMLEVPEGEVGIRDGEVGIRDGGGVGWLEEASSSGMDPASCSSS